MKFLIIDNYDSFVYNIAQRLGELGINSDVIRNDKITIDEIKKRNYDAIVISPIVILSFLTTSEFTPSSPNLCAML